MRFKVSCLICAGASQGFSFWLSFTVARCGARVYGRSASTESFIELDMLTINYSATNEPGDREDPSKPSTCASAIPLQKSCESTFHSGIRFRKGTCALPRRADKSGCVNYLQSLLPTYPFRKGTCAPFARA